MIGSRIKSKICCFSGRRVLVATRSRSRSDTTPWCHSLRSRRFATSTPTGKNSNRIDTPIRSENLIVSGPSRTPVPTGKNSNRIDTPNVRFFSAQGIWKIVRRPRRRFAPWFCSCVAKLRLRCAPLRVTHGIVNYAQTRRGDHWSPALKNLILANGRPVVAPTVNDGCNREFCGYALSSDFPQTL